MKKFLIIFLVVVVALSALYFVGTGFMERSDVYLGDYSVSEDGTELTFNASVASSMWFIRGYKDEGGGVKPHQLTFYSTFGGLNSSFGAKNEFVLELDEDDTEIYFKRGKHSYKLVLKKNEETGVWERLEKKDENIAETKTKTIPKPEDVKEIPLSDVEALTDQTVLTQQEAEKLCGEVLGDKAEENGFPISYRCIGAVSANDQLYYVMHISWLVDNSHWSYIGNCFVSVDGQEIYDGVASQGKYEMTKLRWEK